MLEWPSFPHPPPLRSERQQHGCGSVRRRGCVDRSGTGSGSSVRLRRNCEPRAGCLRCLLSDSRLDLFITGSIEASIEYRTLKYAQQPVACWTTPAAFPEEDRYASWPWFSLPRFPLFLWCTRKPRLPRRTNNLPRRSTRPDLYTGLNGRNRGSQGKGLFWLRLINRPAGLLERECFRALGTNNWTVRLWKRIRSGVSSQAQDLRSRFPLSLRVGPNLRHPNEQFRSRQFCTRC